MESIVIENKIKHSKIYIKYIYYAKICIMVKNYENLAVNNSVRKMRNKKLKRLVRENNMKIKEKVKRVAKVGTKITSSLKEELKFILRKTKKTLKRVIHFTVQEQCKNPTLHTKMIKKYILTGSLYGIALVTSVVAFSSLTTSTQKTNKMNTVQEGLETEYKANSDSIENNATSISNASSENNDNKNNTFSKDSKSLTESKQYAKIKSGNTFTVALKEDGTVWSWGKGTNGQLGTGNTNDQTQPVQVLAPDGVNKLTDVIDIAVGYYGASALLSDGTIVSWGGNENYNLGDGTTTNRSIPVYVLDGSKNKLNNIIKIAKGIRHTLALTANGEVYAWGNNKYGQLGKGTSSDVGYSVPNKVKDITGNSILKDVIDIETTFYSSYAILSDGSLLAWGKNDVGELAIGSTYNASLPKVSKITNIAKLSTGEVNIIALTEDGKLYSCGHNGNGALGDGTTTNRNIPVQPKFDANTLVTDRVNVIDIGIRGTTHYILDDNNKIYAVGYNENGQIGDNTTTNRSYFVEVKGKYGENLSDKFVNISSSITGNAYFIREDGSLFGVGSNTNYQLLGKMTENLKAAKEMNTSYMEITERVNYIKQGETKKLETNVVENFNIYAKKPVIGNITWSSSNAQIAKVDENGNITALKEGQTTIIAKEDKYGYTAMSTIYVTRNAENIITIPQVEQGGNFTVVLRADGTVWATGENNYGQCGTSLSEKSISELTQIKIDENTPLTNIVKISAGIYHAIALTKDGKVYSWGCNLFGQLGINSKTSSTYAVQMLNTLGTEPIKDIIDISASQYFSTVLTEEGEVYACGYNNIGQLGDGTTTQRLLPVKMEEVQNIVQISAGDEHSLMLRGDSTVWAVGNNNSGQLGNNSTSNATIPKQVINKDKNGVLKNVVQISAGREHNVVLTSDKKVYTWGKNSYGQLGINSTTNYSYPQTLLDPTDLITVQEGEERPNSEVIGKIAKIGTSASNTLIITDNNKVFATGKNAEYQLSQNNNTNLLTIKQLYGEDGKNYIENIINVPSSSENDNNTALIKADGYVFISGKGTNGQIGNGKNEDVQHYTRMSSLQQLNTDKIVTIVKGSTKQLNAKVTAEIFNVYEEPKEETNIPDKYTSLGTSIATVDENGLVTAVAQGSTKIKIEDTQRKLTVMVTIEVIGNEQDKVKAQIEAGTATVLLKTDGSVWTWGANDFGQRGIGNTDTHLEETQVLDPNGIDKLTDIINVSSGQNFMVALKKDGRVVAWGDNQYGQLGNGNNDNKSIPVYVTDSEGNELTDIIKVSCGSWHTIALKKDGSVWAWGNGSDGRLGNNTETHSNVAIKVKGILGKGYLTDICDITAQAWSSVALSNTGEVYSWGANARGQLGNGTKTNSKVPVKSSITNVAKIVGGWGQTMAIKNDGTLWAWGYNGNGELGYGLSSTSTSSSYYCKTTPVQVKINSSTYLTNVVDVGTTEDAIFAKTANGEIYGWGNNATGTLGINSTTNTAYATRLKTMYGETLTDKIAILGRGTKDYTNYMIKEDGTVLGSGRATNGKLLTARTENVTTVTELKPDYLEIDKRASWVKQGEVVKLNAQIVNRLNAFLGIKLGELQWSSSNTNIATVSNDGTVTTKALGETTITVEDKTNGYKAQAIVYVIQNNEKAVAVPHIAQGMGFTVILKSDGTVWATGLNSNGQLGDGTIENKTKPVQVKIDENTPLTNIVKISAGNEHVLALSENGEVYAWGANSNGQLGNGTTVKNIYATKVLDNVGKAILNKVIDINSGHAHSIVLLENGEVFGFGRNDYGQLGTLDNTDKLLPTKMDGISNAVKVQASALGTAIQNGDGKILTTGWNSNGGLGQNHTSTGSTNATKGKNYANYVINTTKNGILKDIVKVASGYQSTIALTKDGKALVWGYNRYGQLGTGNTTSYSYPVTMKVKKTGTELIDKVIDIGASEENTIVKTIDEQGKEHILITGYNGEGQLGNGTITNESSLIPVNNEDNTQEKEGLDILPDNSRSTNNMGYIDKQGNVWTVGLNTYGAIGDDTLYQRKNIVKIGEDLLIPEEFVFTMKQNDTKQINVDLENSFNVYIKEKEQLSLEYESLDTNIATVNEQGLVTAIGEGRTSIKVQDKTKNIQTVIIIKVLKNQENMKYEPMVTGGISHSVALKQDGSVWTWGGNTYGQLGNNSTATTEEPTQVLGKDGIGLLEDVKMVAAGHYHTLALKNDGSVWAWGYNNNGQLGNNTQTNRYTPVQVLGEKGEGYLKDIIYISAGEYYSIAVNKKGEVYSWGNNNNGQLGDGTVVTRHTPVKAKANLTGVIQVASKYNHTVALKSDGTVWGWGYNAYGQLSDNTMTNRTIPVKALETQDTYITDAIEISASYFSTIILKNDGTVISVGRDADGELGDNNTTEKHLPVKVVNSDNTGYLSGITSIRNAGYSTYALTKEGKIYAWGSNSYGHLGNNSTTNSLKPVLVKDNTGNNELKDISYIGAGTGFALSIDKNGYVQAWGNNNKKQLGNATLVQSELPVYIGSKLVATPNELKLQIGDTQELKITVKSFNLFESENNVQREITFKSLNEDIATVNETGIITAVSMGVTRIIAKDTLSGKVIAVDVSVLEEGNVTPKIVSGLNHTVALKSDGTVWTWGYNNYGQLGNGTNESSNEPIQVEIENVVDVAAGHYFSIALKADGTVWAWGYNNYGQLGQGDTNKVYNPIQVKGVNGEGYLGNITKISARGSKWLALLDTKEVVGCGYNLDGDLGDNTTTNRYTPVYMLNYNGVGNVTNIKDIEMGANGTIILKEDGTVWGTGYNGEGELGIGHNNKTTKIQQVKDSTGKDVLSNIIQISIGATHTLALDSEGNIWSFGHNNYGQLGINNLTNKNLPQRVLGIDGIGNLQNIVSISAGKYTSFAIDDEGQVYSWGYNNYGQLGLNNKTTYKAPKKVLDENGNIGLNNVILASSYGENTKFVKGDGTVWTVGYNANGELGNGFNTNTQLVSCISIPKLVVDQKVLTFNSVGETKKINAKVSSGFNLLRSEIETDNYTYEILDTNIATIANENTNVNNSSKEYTITSAGEGETYIRIRNEEFGILTTVKVIVLTQGSVVKPKIVGGNSHFVALKADGTVWAWGYNNNGELGIEQDNVSKPTDTNQKDVIDIAAGDNFTVLLKKDGTVWATGSNGSGQLGQNNTTMSKSFIQVKSHNGKGYLTDVIDITANGSYVAALKKDGTVWAWGYNRYGQLGNNSTTSKYLPTRVANVNNIMDIAAGEKHLVLLDSDGSVWATGKNDYGQLGINYVSSRDKGLSVPVKMLNSSGNGELTNISKIVAGTEYTLLVTESGTLLSCGYNNYGQLAQGNIKNALLPVISKDSNGNAITNVKDISAKGYLASILREDGTVWTVGQNIYGAAANGTKTNNNLYKQVLSEDRKQVFTNGILVSNTSKTIAIADNNGKVYTSGYNGEHGQLGINNSDINSQTYLECITKINAEIQEKNIILNLIGTTKQIEIKKDLGLNILCKDLEEDKITFKSQNEKIVTVDDNGLLTSLKFGSTIINVKNENTKRTESITVKVLGKGGITIPKVESGRWFSVALKADGTVWAWGNNNYGQLGLNTTSTKILKPTKINLNNVVDIACGDYFTLFLKQDGTVWATGLNSSGQLGNNSKTTKEIIPVKVKDLSDIIKIATGNAHALALKSDGTVWAWGGNGSRQLGDGTTTKRLAPVQVQNLQNIKEISAGMNTSFAVDSYGDTYAWGSNTYGKLGLGKTTTVKAPEMIWDVRNVSTVSTKNDFTLLLTEKGDVYSFGLNTDGQLGLGNTEKQISPKKINSLSNIEYISAGYDHALAKRSDGTVYGWGKGAYYQFGNENKAKQLYPIKIKYDTESQEITDAFNLSSGYNHSIIVKEDGTVWSAGYNGYGQLGDNTQKNKPVWVCISNMNLNLPKNSVTIKNIGGTYELKPILEAEFNLFFDDSEARYEYISKDTDIATVNENGIITGVKRGKTTVKIKEINSNKTSYVEVKVLEENDIAFPQIVTKGNFTIALKNDGTVWSWGDNSYGQLGLGDKASRVAPIKININNIIQISASPSHVLALTKDGDVYSWGDNTYGQLGQNSTDLSYSNPYRVVGTTGNGMLTDIVAVSAGKDSSMALDKYGNVYTWGLNDSGQIGNGTKSTSPTDRNYKKLYPIKLNTISDIVKIESGPSAKYAISKDGRVYSWGYNYSGQLGDRSRITRVLPVDISKITGNDISEIIDISAGDTNQVIALKFDGAVYGWGSSYLGSLTDVGGSIPQQIKGIDGNRMQNIKSISTGEYAGLALTNEGKVLAWGSNSNGQLGNGTTQNSSIPIYVKETEEKELSDVIISVMGKNYSMFVKENGEVWAVGDNNNGQLGNGSKATINMPENISQDYISTNLLNMTFKQIDETQKIEAKYNSGFNLLNKENSKDINYTVEDTSIAVVDNEGNVTAKGIGKTYMHITSGNLERRIEINVLKENEIAVMDIQAGQKHTVGLKTDGTLWAFGDNNYGQLGLGKIEKATYNEPMEITTVDTQNIKFIKISVGGNHTLALDTEGNVYSWGSNSNGQLGLANDMVPVGASIAHPERIAKLSNITKIGTSSNRSMAIDKDGNLYVWGVGYGSIPNKVSFQNKVIDITGKLILSEAGTVWKLTDLTQKIPSLTNIVEISSGDSHDLALKADGKVYAWGNNAYGQLGTGDGKNYVTPALVKNTQEAESIKCGQYSSYILSRDGKIYTFGRNTNNCLGQDSSENYIAEPRQIQSENVQRISAGQNYGAYVNNEGLVYTWGINTSGQLGHGDKQQRNIPTLIGELKIVPKDRYITIQEGEEYNIDVTLNNGFTLRQTNVTTDTVGENIARPDVEASFTYKSINNKIASVNNTTLTGLNTGLTTIVVTHKEVKKAQNIYVEVLRKDTKSVIDVKAANNFTIALKADGSVWSWGQNANGELSLKDNNNYNEPKRIELNVRARQIAVGNNHTVILTEEGKVLTSGLNSNGQLGNGTLTKSNALVEVIDEYGQIVENIAQIGAKGNTTYLLDYEGNIYGIGEGYSKVATKIKEIKGIAQIEGQYGITQQTKVIEIETKQEIEGLENIIKTATGENHALFLNNEGIIYAIGTNENGQCGNGTKVNSIAPSIVKNRIGTENLNNVKDISAGKNFSIAVLENGEVYTWGSNENNKLSSEQNSDQVLPKKLVESSNGIIVSAGTNHGIYANT